MAYTAGDLRDAVRDDLKDASFSSARILRYLNRGQEIIFATHNFKFCEKSVSGALTVGEYTYEQQDDHDGTIGGVLVDPDNTSRTFVVDEDSYLAHRDFFKQVPDPELNDNNMPTAWTEFGDQVYFSCPVDVAYTFTQRYFRTPTEMTTDADVPDVPALFRDLLEQYALYRAEKYRGNHDVAATYKQAFEDGLESMAIRYGERTQVTPTVMRNVRTAVDV